MKGLREIIDNENIASRFGYCSLVKGVFFAIERVKFNSKAALKVYKGAFFAVTNIPVGPICLIALQKVHLQKKVVKIESELMPANPSKL